MAEFDPHSHNYREQLERSIRGLGSVDGAIESKLQVLGDIARRRPAGPSSRVLDFGCGTGLLTDALRSLAANRYGVDVSVESLKQSVSPHSHFTLFDGKKLPFRDEAFDLVVASCVFHHILPDARLPALQEIQRVLACDGVFVLIEHNPYNPVTRFVVNRCEFDKDAQLLSLGAAGALLQESGLHVFRQGYFYAVPPVNRVLAAIDRALSWLPLGAQYYCAYTRTPLRAA